MWAFAVFAVKTVAADGLQADYQLTEGRTTRTYAIALDELAVVSRAGTTGITPVPVFPTAEDLRQFAVQLGQTSGNDVRLVVYPAGATRSPGNRRVVTRQLIARLENGVDPNGLAAAVGLTYRGGFTYLPGVHLFESPVAGGSLTASTALQNRPGVLHVEVQLASVVVPHFIPNDPLFGEQWHLLNTGQQGGTPGIDANVTNVWDTFRGAGINVVIMDTGMELTHPDLVPNLNTNLGIDVLAGDNDPSAGTNEFHATAVAGIAAARGNNGLGVSGAAPFATVIPIRLLGGGPTFLTDLQQANGISHSNAIVHVHNNSWGPGSQGLDIAPLGTLMSNALVQGITSGRSGLGTIYVFSSGNSAGVQGDGNQVQQINSIYTIAVGALIDTGARASYSTPGACLVVSAPSGLDAASMHGSTTTDMLGTNGYNNSTFPNGDLADPDYTQFFNGTSSAAPLVSGVIALILEANPLLGWRDVQEILIRSAVKVSPNDSQWITNGSGIHFNHDFGAGMVNAAGALQLATNWVNLSPQIEFGVSVTNLAATIPDASANGITHVFPVTNQNFRIEHVALVTDIQHPNRGDLDIRIISPSGSESRLFLPHSGDTNRNLIDYEMTSFRHWGEIPAGNWQVRVADGVPSNAGVLNSLQLKFYGSFTNSTPVPTNPPAITQNPVTKTVTQNSTVSLTVQATGTPPLLYQWMLNGNNIIGANSTIYAITNVQPAQAGTYTVRVFNQFGEAFTVPALLFVNAPPVITGQPQSLGSRQGSNVTFTVTVAGAAPLAYVWRRNGRPVPGATGSALTIAGVQTNDYGVYDVLVSNPLASVFSQAATLAFLPPWSILSQPQPTNVVTGGTAQLSVSLSDAGPFSYQWTVNSTNVPNGTSATLTLNNLQVAQSGAYSVLISDSRGSLASSNALLTVYSPFVMTNFAAPVNGNFGLTINGDEGRRYRLEGSTDLTNWVAITTNTIAGGSTALLDTAARTFDSRFYRVVLLP